MTTSSRSMIRRLAPYFSARIRHNSRLLSSSSAVAEPRISSTESPSPSADAVHITDSCVRRMKELQADEASEKLLRLSIEAGGCSGFQYNFSLDDKTNDDDRIFERDGVKLVVDDISFDFVKGATVDYVEELIRSAFQVCIVVCYHHPSLACEMSVVFTVETILLICCPALAVIIFLTSACIIYVVSSSLVSKMAAFWFQVLQVLCSLPAYIFIYTYIGVWGILV